MLACREAIAILGDYVAAELGGEAAQRLERHLAEGDECVAYLRTYRRTRQLAAGAMRTEMPAALRARLREFLLSTLRRR